MTYILDGWHGDSSRMYPVGQVKRAAERLLEVTYECLMRGIAAVRPGARTGAIGAAIQTYAEAERCSVVRDFCGHGVGQLFHDAPNILHYGSASEGVGAARRHDLHHRADDQSRPAACEGAVRRLDGRDARPLAVGAVRAHGRRHRDGCEIFTLSPDGLDRPGLPSLILDRSAANDAPSSIWAGLVMAQDEDATSAASSPRASVPRRTSRSAAGRSRSRTISAIATGCASASASAATTALADYELLELLLFRLIPRARHQADRQGAARSASASLAEVLGAPAARLQEVKGVGASVALDLKVIAAAARRMTRGEIKGSEVLSSWAQVLDYCRATMAFEEREQFRILFLDKKNALIADEVQQTGTVDHTPVYPREVVRRALELSATAIILVHNHPSGDPTPSRADIEMTKTIVDIGQAARDCRPRPHHRRQEGPCQHEGPDADLKRKRPRGKSPARPLMAIRSGSYSASAAFFLAGAFFFGASPAVSSEAASSAFFAFLAVFLAGLAAVSSSSSAISSSFDTLLSVTEISASRWSMTFSSNSGARIEVMRVGVVAVEVEDFLLLVGRETADRVEQRALHFLVRHDCTPALSPISASTRPRRTRRSASFMIFGARLFLGRLLVGEGLAGAFEVAVHLVPDVGELGFDELGGRFELVDAVELVEQLALDLLARHRAELALDLAAHDLAQLARAIPGRASSRSRR